MADIMLSLKERAMAKVLRGDQTYAGRRADVAVLNFTVDKEAAALLRVAGKMM